MGAIIGRTIGKIALTLALGAVSALGFELGKVIADKVKQEAANQKKQSSKSNLRRES